MFFFKTLAQFVIFGVYNIKDLIWVLFYCLYLYKYFGYMYKHNYIIYNLILALDLMFVYVVHVNKPESK